MTSLKNTSDSDREEDGPSDNERAKEASSHPERRDGSGDGRDADWNEAWEQFTAEHKDDFDRISHSHNAKCFERRARKHHTQPLLSVDDLSRSSFTRDHSSNHGPRDFEGTSWLDVDDVMDSHDDFIPPDPKVEDFSTSKLVFWLLLIIGTLGVIASVLFSRYVAPLATIFGLCALVGATGLIIRHRGFTETRQDATDDGARV
ncbi:hypothetical protein [Bifidobacterium bombi]|uniref:Membrane associated protein n=1 Tax=Bifidobacterium bombi DSM 19703 TaxID=1341695 RepID=A0A080N623_9BIFI|nr:hypothetical protein [Bifidobacterium bombi]KFF31209.1 hypothetical protein BBOMB_0546 [Bifidobacterium bombi DSM 19703]